MPPEPGTQPTACLKPRCASNHRAALRCAVLAMCAGAGGGGSAAEGGEVRPQVPLRLAHQEANHFPRHRPGASRPNRALHSVAAALDWLLFICFPCTLHLLRLAGCSNQWTRCSRLPPQACCHHLPCLPCSVLRLWRASGRQPWRPSREWSGSLPRERIASQR